MKLSFLINSLTQKYRDKAKRNNHDNDIIMIIIIVRKKERKKEREEKGAKTEQCQIQWLQIHLIFTVLLNYK